MAYELKEGNGTLFINNKKEEGDNRPNYTGKVVINGEKRFVSVWVKTPTGGGNRFLSISISERRNANCSDPLTDDLP